jgi:hypothetical protein
MQNIPLLIYSFTYIVIRIFVFAKVFFLLCMTYYYPESYNISLLNWWMYFLIFDIWIMVMLPDKKYHNNNDNTPIV